MCNACVDIQEVKSLFSLFGYWGSNRLDGKHFYPFNHLFSPHLIPPHTHLLNFIFYVYGYFPWICILCLPDANRGQKKVLDHLELELEVVVRHHASGIWTCILYKSSSCSWLRSHLIWDPKENDLLKYVWWKIWKLYSTGKQKVVQFLKTKIIACIWCDLFKFYFGFSNIKLMK